MQRDARELRHRDGGDCRPARAGFTIIEIIGVLVVLAILAIVALPRLTPQNPHAVAEADALRAVLRYAQARAMSDVYSWGVTFTSTSYTLVTDNGSQTPVLLGFGTATHDLPDGVTCTCSNDQQRILFNWRGEPVSGHVTTPGDSGTAVTSTQTITLTESGASESITVTPYTGFVP